MIAIGTVDFSPKDDAGDGNTVILSITARSGGLESERFAADFLNMYLKYAELQSWRVDLLLITTSGPQFIREAVIRITGTDTYRRLRHETGVHRVQRVPEDEQQGRMKTSTVSVAVSQVPQSDEKIRTYNYPDDRVTDHRANRSVLNLERILGGELDPLINLITQE